MSEREKPTVSVTAKCIQCGHRREIQAGEVGPGGQPMCDRCYGVMVPERAQATSEEPDHD